MYISRILVPIDFSERSANGLRYAASLAQKTNAEVIALHVISKKQPDFFPYVLAAFEGWPMPPQETVQMPIDRQVSERALDLCNFIQTVLGEGRRPEIRREVAIGKPLKEIVSVAREKRADLIVLEMRRRSLLSYLKGWRGMLRLAWRSPCPVLFASSDGGRGEERSARPRWIADAGAPQR